MSEKKKDELLLDHNNDGVVPVGRLRSVLGITDVNYVQRQHALAVVDSTLA